MLLPQLTRNSQGYAVVLALIAVAAVGALAVYIMQTSNVMTGSDDRDMVTFDRENLLTELKMVLATGDNCRLSVTGSFKKSQINMKEKQDGLPVEVWVGDGLTKVSGKLKDGDSYYKLKIQSVRLFMDKGAAQDLPQGRSSELGTLRVKYNAGAGGDMFLDLPLRVSVITNMNGQSTILTCQVPVSEDYCDAVGMTYDSGTGGCGYEVTCMEWTELASADDEWTGEAGDKCWDNYGSHLRELTLTQGRPEQGVNLESNGMLARCCFPRNMMSVQCYDFETAAEPQAWEGNKEAFCNLQADGLLSGVIFSQKQTEVGSEVNGLMIRCCYPW